MNKSNDIKNKIENLKKEINEHNKYYYDQNISKISDNEFDSLMQSLVELENKYPHLKTDDSPTQKVNGLINDKFLHYEHLIPMLSLSNAFSYEELYNFDNRIKKSLNKKIIRYYCECKIDGLSISLIYKNGKLYKGITRGDGETGEDITKNIYQIKSVPKIIDYKDDLIIRGEIFFTNEQFNVINLEKKAKNEKEFSNSRNAASGTLRQLNSKIVKDRNLSIFCYFVDKKHNEKTQDEDIKFLEKYNFPINKKYNKLVNSIDDVIAYIKDLENLRYELDYTIDGIVIKVNQHSYQKELGETSKFPKWAIAYKFEAIRKCTLLEDIYATVGRTGKITFNASLKPIELSGTIVKSATLHNADYIIKNDIRIGDYVWIKKAGDIIPKVIKPNINKRNNLVIKWEPIVVCPECHEKLIRKKNKVDLFCINIECHEQYLRLIEHYVSKKGMNIQGISKRILTNLYKLKIINSFIDLYKLEEKKQEILKINKFGEKMFNNIIEAINSSKKVSLDKFIYALGIHNVGSYTATIIANKFKSIHKLLHIKRNELDEINDIGPTISDNIYKYFKNKDNKKKIKQLINNFGVEIYFEQSTKKFSGKIFIFTGKLLKPRNEYTNRIKKLGGHISSTISKKTTYLIAGEHPGSKYIKAKNLEINIISEEELEKLLKG